MDKAVALATFIILFIYLFFKEMQIYLFFGCAPGHVVS